MINTRLCCTNLIKLSKLIVRNETSTRFYARWAHRRPAKVFTSEEYGEMKNPSSKNLIELKPDEIETKHVKEHNRLINNKPILFDMESLDEQTHLGDKREEKRKEKKKIKYTQDEVLNAVFDENGNFIYEKMKDNDPKIATLMLMVKSRKLRNKKECILLEGKRLIHDALEAGCVIQHLLFSRKSDLEHFRNLLPVRDVQLYKMAYRDVQMWSDLTTCPGIMGIFKMPTMENIKRCNESIPLTIICDNIREPGNLGAILRASIAVGCRQIFLTKGCVDLWESKVLRSSCGAHFRLPIYKSLKWDEIRDQLPPSSNIFLADNNIVTSDLTTESSDHLRKLFTNVPILPYYSIQYSNYDSVVLVVGGETMGLSQEAYNLASETKGLRLNIPLSNDVDSLNTGTALGVIIFEIKRQLLMKE